MVLRRLIYLFLVGSLWSANRSNAQQWPLFDQPAYLDMVDRGGDLLYNGRFDSARVIIDSLGQLLPRHPVVPMMHAMNWAWRDQPMRTTSSFYVAQGKAMSALICHGRSPAV